MAAGGRTKFRSVARGNPCAVCGGTDKCSRGADGLLLCGRRRGYVPGFVYLGQSKRDDQWGEYRAENDPVLREREDERRRERARRTKNHHRRNGTSGPGPNSTSGPGPRDDDLESQARRFAAALTAERRCQLAEALGLPEAVLATLPLLGYSADDPHGPCWTFPEHDGAGQLVGIIRRYLDGTKKAVPGGSRGLTVPDGWQDRHGPVYLPEGQSDTLALTAMGLPAVGRPSNTGGVEQLDELLADWPEDRPVIVLDETDPKPDGRFPGKEGAIKTAEGLARESDRVVYWVMPPDGAKDVRRWVLDQEPDATCSDTWQLLGERLAAEVQRDLQAVEPAAAAGFAWSPIDAATFSRMDCRPGGWSRACWSGTSRSPSAGRGRCSKPASSVTSSSRSPPPRPSWAGSMCPRRSASCSCRQRADTSRSRKR
jgi:hypothetical protein